MSPNPSRSRDQLQVPLAQHASLPPVEEKAPLHNVGMLLCRIRPQTATLRSPMVASAAQASHSTRSTIRVSFKICRNLQLQHLLVRKVVSQLEAGSFDNQLFQMEQTRTNSIQRLIHTKPTLQLHFTFWSYFSTIGMLRHTLYGRGISFSNGQLTTRTNHPTTSWYCTLRWHLARRSAWILQEGRLARSAIKSPSL